MTTTVRGFMPDLPLCQWVERTTEGGTPLCEIRGPECFLWIEPRPPYCDRGDWKAGIDVWGTLGRDFDFQDGWPRYYFDRDRAKLEVEAWMKKRGQWVEAPKTEQPREQDRLDAILRSFTCTSVPQGYCAGCGVDAQADPHVEHPETCTVLQALDLLGERR